MCSNTEMYGVADLEAYVATVQASEVYRTRGLAMVVSNTIGAAQDLVALDSCAALQQLNRARFLIARLCPLPQGKEAHLAV